jgi:hypothetical protein
MLQGRDAEVADAVDAVLERGPVTVDMAEDFRKQFERDWRRVERFANLGASLRAPGLGEAIVDLLETNPEGDLNQEDLVDILGEIGAAESASTIFRVVRRSVGTDAPAFWLIQKAILALSAFETAEADGYLREMTGGSWPDPIRWHAAVALCVEDELGFDEEAMLE